MRTKSGTHYTMKMKIFSDRHAEFRSDDVDLREHWTGEIPIYGWELPGEAGMADSFGGFGQTQAVAALPPSRYPMHPGMILQMNQNQGMQRFPGLNGAQDTPDLMNNGPSTLESFGAESYNNVVQNGELNNYGQFYKILWKRQEVNEKCTQTIEILGQPDKATALINDQFLTTCDEKVPDLMIYKGDEVLVGGIDQNNLVVYGHKDIPEQLIVVMSEECIIYTYRCAVDHPNNKATFLGVGNECQQVKALIKNIQDEFAKEPQTQKEDYLKARHQELNNLVKDWIKGSEETSFVGRIGQEELGSTDDDSPSSSNTNTAPVPTVAPKKKKHWLRRKIWRRMTCRPTTVE